jgi:hypothetical protein
MRKLLLISACAIALSAQAQVITPAIIAPSPVGIVLTVGKWLWDANKQEQVYYIEVTGEGRTVDESTNNGFRLAIEQAIGSIIASETEVQNSRIVRDEIINYASGYVDKFEIVKQEAGGLGVKTTMKVWVRRSSLSNRLLNRSEKVGEIDGPRSSVQLSTLNKERANGDRLVVTVLNDFPKRAFDIELKSTELKYGSRRGTLEIPFRVSWNSDYLKSLWTALEATSQKSSNPQARITINSGGWFKGFGGTLNYDDNIKLNMINSALVGTRPAVLITIRSNENAVLFRQCFNWPELDHNDGYVVRDGRFVRIAPYGNITTINGGFTLDGIAPIPAHPWIISSASRVEADIVRGASCPK